MQRHCTRNQAWAAVTELSKQVHVLGDIDIGVEDITSTVSDREVVIDVVMELEQEQAAGRNNRFILCSI